ncbi:MAG: hypothetical protein WC725_02390 [Patescibacteria group bacterium]|jgi:hypothetical protein
MKYKSSLTNEIKITIIVLLLFWVINISVITNTNGVRDALGFSLLMFGFAVAYILALTKGAYLIIENNGVKYVHLFVIRRIVEIKKIVKYKKV